MLGKQAYGRVGDLGMLWFVWLSVNGERLCSPKPESDAVPAVYNPGIACCTPAWGASAALLGAFAKFRKAAVSFIMSVCPFAWNNWTPTGRIFMKFDRLFSKICREISSFIKIRHE
jgi:hypothetical protein